MSDLYSITQENSNVEVYLSPVEGIPGAIFYGWKGYLAGEHYRNALLRLIDELENRRIRYVLHDYSKIRVIHPSDQLWFNNKAIPMLNSSQVTHSFMVKPEDPMAQRCLYQMSGKSDPYLYHEIKVFDTYDEAYQALKNEVANY
ncbi:MAG: hypothetical protein WBB45_01285 [Cyclobacteriaceae bacterium]